MRRGLGLALLAATGCWDLLPASRDPTTDAEHREREVCPRGMPAYPEGLFHPDSVVQVAPFYLTKSERGYQGQYLFGATITLRPLSGVTFQELESMLDCHSARSELRRPGEPVIPNDPYWLPGHVVRISVVFEQGVTRVNVEGRDFAASNAILERARAFAREAGPANDGTPDSGPRL
jgi:hypothetical protein